MAGSYRKLIANLRSIQADRAEAAADKARLDWLGARPELLSDVSDRMATELRSIRDAIDDLRDEHGQLE